MPALCKKPPLNKLNISTTNGEGYDDTRAQSTERPDASRPGPLPAIVEIWIDRSLRRTAHVIQGGFGDDRGGDLDCQR